MALTFNLTDVNGRQHSWHVQDGDYVLDRHGHVMSFTVRFNDGTVKTFALGEDGGFVRRLLSTKLDEVAGAGAGGMAGRPFGLVGMALGAVAGWMAAEILENVVLENADYYDSAGNKWFHGVIRA